MCQVASTYAAKFVQNPVTLHLENHPRCFIDPSPGYRDCAAPTGNQWQLALVFFDDMTVAKLRPDVINFNAAISACEKQGRWQEAARDQSYGLRDTGTQWLALFSGWWFGTAMWPKLSSSMAVLR